MSALGLFNLLAAFLTFAIGLAHSFLGERYILIRLFRRIDLPKLFGGTEFTVRTLRFAWHLTTVSWGGAATLFFFMAKKPLSSVTVSTVLAAVFLASAGITLIVSRGRIMKGNVHRLEQFWGPAHPIGLRVSEVDLSDRALHMEEGPSRIKKDDLYSAHKKSEQLTARSESLFATCYSLLSAVDRCLPDNSLAGASGTRRKYPAGFSGTSHWPRWWWVSVESRKGPDPPPANWLSAIGCASGPQFPFAAP